jgi:putative serine protease PepD
VDLQIRRVSELPRLALAVSAIVSVSVIALGAAGCGDASEGTSATNETSTTTETSTPTETSTTTEAQSSAGEASGLLGATITTATAGEPGAVVQSVPPASNTLLKPGDVIVAINGTPVAGTDDVVAAIGTPKIGNEITLRIVRGSHRIRFREVPSPTAYLGANVRDGGGGNPGAVVDSVAKDSPAAASDIRPGDVITALDDTQVDDVDDLLTTIATHAPGDTVTVALSRGSRELAVKATLADRPN